MSLPDKRTIRERILEVDFVWIVVLCCLACFAFVIGNIIVLGWHRQPADPIHYIADADPELGKRALQEYGCGACHVIPGIANASGRVGPRLTDIHEQIYLGGVLANTPENMIRWIRFPEEVAPNTAMPNLNVSEEEAKHMASYLYSLSKRSIFRDFFSR